ncbi:hypothetical protein NEFER03_0386 [Nematocida sp. LUAm3]|nr:hypothetical protein NEFER03_0386 [Nematocida sp. LUAm3]KAI5175998.1 hypothetical protein NEFER02_1844 [Nematocida sp. LUAm2]KAI5179094.1 hypothetical protein NEFER01_1961 [Nematocida sp. LUAm1]
MEDSKNFLEKKESKEIALISEFLRLECCTDTLAELAEFSEENINFRLEIKKWIKTGEIEKACDALEKKYPSLLKENLNVCSFLHSQLFIELVRRGEPEKALLFGRSCIQNGEDITQTNDLFLLLAYKNPEESEVSKGFLKFERREEVFMEVDALLKKKMYGNSLSLLEQLMQIKSISNWLKKSE